MFSNRNKNCSIHESISSLFRSSRIIKNRGKNLLKGNIEVELCNGYKLYYCYNAFCPFDT